MAPVARYLSDKVGVIEPFQRAYSVEEQVQEVVDILEGRQDRTDTTIPLDITVPTTLIGHSWGAWMAWLVAAHHPEMVGRLILVSSGPFEDRFASTIMGTRLERMDQEQKEGFWTCINAMNDREGGDPHPHMVELGGIMLLADSYELADTDTEALRYDPRQLDEVWAQASLLRTSGDLLDMASSIECPVVAIHGDHDPHPWEGVALLEEHLDDFTFHLLKDCGHYPWLERAGREPFFDILRKVLP